MALQRGSASEVSLSNYSKQETGVVIDEGMGKSPKVVILESPITPDDSSSDSMVLISDNFMGMPMEVTDTTEIAQEIEVETTPMTPESANRSNQNSFSTVLQHGVPESSVSILMRNVEYEDISDDEEDSKNEEDDSAYTSQLVSLLTPESRLDEDCGHFSADSSSTNHSTATSSIILSSAHLRVKAIPVSTIKWAPKKVQVEDDEVMIINEVPECPVPAPPICTGRTQDDGDDVVFLGEYCPRKAILPCFLPCCYNALENAVTPVRVWHPPHPISDRNDKVQSKTMIPRPFIKTPLMQLLAQPSVRKSIPIIPLASQLVVRKPSIFPEPPPSEWTRVKVYHLDPSDGILRYKCRSCNGMVEQRSVKSRFQLCNLEMNHQCSQCERKYHTKRQLQHHLFRHKERRLSCCFCSRKFLTKPELQNHINTHTRQKPYGCPVCPESFAHSSRYYSHVRNFHKKYDCHDCFLKICEMPLESVFNEQYQ